MRGADVHGLWRVARRRLGFLLAPALLVAVGPSAPLPIRIALIIGNGSYAFSDPLPNALSDARKLADKLDKLGFAVEPDTFDLDQDKLVERIGAFGDKLRTSGPNVVGFFYYAGHAAQDAFGVNYLLPVSAKARTPAEIRNEGTAVQSLLQAMEDANNPINIVVLDACRDWYKDDRRPEDPKGLHDMGLHASMLIAYATRADDTASEGTGLDSSPFSRRLIEAMDKQPSDPIVLLFDDVKTLVYSDTDAGQYPLLVDGLTVSGRWSLTSGVLATVADKPDPAGASGPLPPFLAGLDRARLVTFFRGQESLADTLLAGRDIIQKYEITTPDRLAYFLASIGYETGGFAFSEERFGYSAARLRQLYPRKVTSDALARRIAGNPEMVANVIYGNQLGNGPPESGDGWRYRGRGLFGFFITGRANYAKFGKLVGVDLIASPDVVNDPVVGLAVAAALWFDAKANRGADEDDMRLVKKQLRTGRPSAAELEALTVWLAQARKAVAPAG